MVDPPVKKKGRIFSGLSKKFGHHHGHSQSGDNSFDNASTLSLASHTPQSNQSTPLTGRNGSRRSGDGASVVRRTTEGSDQSKPMEDVDHGRLGTKNPNTYPGDQHIGSPENPIPTGAVGSEDPAGNFNSVDISDSDDDFLEEGSAALKMASNDGGIEFSVMMNEACEDTPSFRASAEYLHIMLTDLEEWLENFSAKNLHVIAQLSNVKNSVNDVISLFMPNVTHCSILAQDYTTLLFGRYTEAEQLFWTKLFVHAARNANDIVTMVRRLRQTTFVKYHHARDAYTAALRQHDQCLAELFRLPHNAELGAQRDATHNLQVARRRFLKASTRLVFIISEVESETSVSLLETLSRQYMSPETGFMAHDKQSIAISIEFHRLQSAAAALRKSLPDLALQLKTIRRSILLKHKNKATRDEIAATITSKAPVRFSWVNVETAPGKWELLWAYMQHGLFGFLGLSENKTAVIESTRFIGASSQFESLADEEKRYLFRIRNANGVFVNAQASTKHDFDHWQQAFMATSASSEASSNLGSSSLSPATPLRTPEIVRSNTFMSFHSHLSNGSSNAVSQNGSSSSNTNVDSLTASPVAQRRRPSTPMWTPQDLQPWNRSFAIPGLYSETVPESDLIVAKIEDLRQDVKSLKWLQYDSTLTSEGTMDFDMKVPSIKPLPTSVQFEAVVANSYFQPDFTCNSVTANLWGCTGLHLSDMTNESVAKQHRAFPEYPDNYARSLVIQDMDMRCIVSQLPSEDQMFPGEIMLFVLRTVTTVDKKDVPARLYVTNHRILVYSSWRGIVSVQSTPVENILDVETIHGVDYSKLRIIVQRDEKSRQKKTQPGEDAGPDAVELEFKLFIDSAVLAKRKLEFVKENGRSASSMSSYDMLGQLAVLSMEHAELLKRHEVQILRNLSWRPPKNDKASKSKPDSEEQDDFGNASESSGSHGNSFASWLLESVVGEGSHRGEEDAMDLGKGMQVKVCEDTFSVKADALFLTVFGSRSPVFSGEQRGIIESRCEIGPWYRKGRRIERRVQEYFYSFGDTGEKRYNVQRLEQLRGDLYVVSERRAPWEMPTGDQFYTVIKYVIYSTNRGSHLQIWSSTIWSNGVKSNRSDHAIERNMRMVGQGILLNIRNAVSQIHDVADARKLFGSVKATKVVTSHGASKTEDNNVTRVTSKTLFIFLIRTPLSMSMKSLNVVRLWFTYISSPMLLLLIVLIGSLAANFVLYGRYTSQYWEMILDRRETNSIIDSLKLAPTQQSVITRAVYTKDLDDSLASGSLWRNHDDDLKSNSSVSESRSKLAIDFGSSGCSAKFAEIAGISLWALNYGSLYQFEPKVELMLRTISDTRLEYAIKRNEMLTMLRILNHKEREALQEVYRNWLITEAAMCSQVRSTLPLLNDSVATEISAYCIGCLKEARTLF